MTGRLLFRPEAEAELREAIAWYEGRTPGLGAEFLQAFEAAIETIRRNPRMYPVAAGTARRVAMRRFPYTVIYAETGPDLLVIACFHVRRDPSRWIDRL